jgi:hypothetical protein
MRESLPGKQPCLIGRDGSLELATNAEERPAAAAAPTVIG